MWFMLPNLKTNYQKKNFFFFRFRIQKDIPFLEMLSRVLKYRMFEYGCHCLFLRIQRFVWMLSPKRKWTAAISIILIMRSVRFFLCGGFDRCTRKITLYLSSVQNNNCFDSFMVFHSPQIPSCKNAFTKLAVQYWFNTTAQWTLIK